MWELLQNRNHLRSELKQCKRNRDLQLLQAAFNAWNGRSDEVDYGLIFQYHAIMQSMHDKTAQMIRHCSKKDKKTYMDMTLQEQNAANKHSTKEMYQKLRTFQPQTPKKRIKTPRAAPFLQGDEGPVESHTNGAKHGKTIGPGLNVPRLSSSTNTF